MLAALYFVECDFGHLGKVFIETDRDDNSRQHVIEDIADGQIENPVKVLLVNEEDGTCRDVTEDIAISVREHLYANQRPIPLSLIDWLAYHAGQKEAAE